MVEDGRDLREQLPLKQMFDNEGIRGGAWMEIEGSESVGEYGEEIYIGAVLF